MLDNLPRYPIEIYQSLITSAEKLHHFYSINHFYIQKRIEVKVRYSGEQLQYSVLAECRPTVGFLETRLIINFGSDRMGGEYLFPIQIDVLHTLSGYCLPESREIGDQIYQPASRLLSYLITELYFIKLLSLYLLPVALSSSLIFIQITFNLKKECSFHL